MPNQGDFFESKGQEVDPIISEIAVVKQLIKERAHSLDLVRELLSNAGAKEVGATEIKVNYYVNQSGHVFEVTDNGCGMSYSGNKALPLRLDRFLGLGLSAIIGHQSDEFSWKGLGSKLSYQSQTVNIESFAVNGREVFKVEINDPWGSINRNVIPRPRIFRFPPEPDQHTGTKIVVTGHPPHRRESPFTMAEIENYLVHRTFVGFTGDRDPKPRIVLTVMGQEKEIMFGFPELKYKGPAEGTVWVDEHEAVKSSSGTNRSLHAHMKGFFTWDAEKFGLSEHSYNTGLILSVKGIPYFDLDMEEYGSQSLRTANPGKKKCCLVVQCDQIQEEMNIARSGLVDSELTDLLKNAVAKIFKKIESSQGYLDFRQVPKQRKTVQSATDLDEKKQNLESVDQRWVVYVDANGKNILLGREPENENDMLAILWKMEAIGALPFARFTTLAHSGDGPDLIVHFQEDASSQPDRYTVVEAERFFYNYKLHGHTPSQYPRVVCWDIGTKSIKVNDTKYSWKKVTSADGVQVNVFSIRHMPGISVISRQQANERKLL